MSVTVCLSANTLDYPEGGGHLWAHLNWALGLRALGCQVIWLEPVHPDTPAHQVRALVAALTHRLRRYGLADGLALGSLTGEPLARGATDGCLDLDAAAEANLFLDLRYDLSAEMVGRFRRSALIDIDPGVLQTWMSKGEIKLAPHDAYFTIGETVGRPGARFPDAGLTWQYTPPCVALNWWPPRRAAANAPFTTLAHWYGSGWMEDEGGWYPNEKRDGFLPFLELPRHTAEALELALDFVPQDEDQILLREQGWQVRESVAVAATPWDYQRYIQESRGEFSCAKPSYVRLATAWVSDRSLCYLASGKPVVVQHTGPSRFLPDAAGLFRFRTPDEAARALGAVAADYDRQCRLAWALAEEFFDARTVVKRVLERALS
jgi:hypothetical protein